MSEVLSIGSLTLDLFFQDQSLTIKKNRFYLAIGGKYVVSDFNQGIGGGGGNIAVGLSRAGIKTSLWAEIGTGGVSKLVLSRLEEEKVNTNSLVVRENLTNISVILLSLKGERTIINHRSHQSEFIFGPKQQEIIRNLKMLYLGNLPEVSLEMRTSILEYAHQHGIKTFLNLGVKDCRLGLGKLKPLLDNVDYFLINRYELADILKIAANEVMPNIVNYQSKLFNNPQSMLVLTDGEFGSYVQTTDQIVHQIAYRVEKVVDATGAGDAFNSGFIIGIYYNLPLRQCLRSGAKNSASVIAKINAQDGLLFKGQLFDQ